MAGKRKFLCGGNAKERAKKSGKPRIAPLNHLPLLPSGPGGVQQELVVPICRCKDTLTFIANASETPGF
jgi:hypothetical protein